MQPSVLFVRKKWFPIKRTVILEIISSLFIILFLYTAFSKLGSYKLFVSVLANSPLIGAKAATLGWLIPAVEIVVVALLVVPATKYNWGLYASTLLMLMFTGYIGYMVYFVGGKLPCSCGGVLNNLNWKEHLVFNAVFLLFGISGILLNRAARKER